MRRGDVLVPLDRNPLEVYLLALAVTSGLSGLVAGGADVPVGSPGWLTWLWYGLLVAGGTVGIVGAWWRDAITAVLIVRAALIPVGAGAYLYALSTARSAGWLSAAMVAGFGVAAHLRAAQISRHLRVERRRK